MNKNKYILYVGYNSFPIGFAQVERQKLIAKGLISCGCEVTIVNRYGVHDIDKKEKVYGSNTFEGIKYIYASGTPFRNKSFLKRNFLKCKGFLNEIRIVRSKKKNKQLDAIIITTNEFYNVIFYAMLSFLYGVPSVLDNVEHWTSIQRKKNFVERIDNYLYDNFACKYVNKIIGISDYLVNIARKKSPRKPVIKIPVIVDFSKFEAGQKSETEFFLYCGSAFYFEVVHFVIDAFERLESNTYLLYIVSNGTLQDMERVKDRINNSTKKNYIQLFTGLEYKRLVELYTISKALLIPLRNTPQDIARFPHKIGEYCAAGKAIISTNIGEIKNYFTDNINALLANEYMENQFSEKMEFVINNIALSEELGQRSYKTGKENFDHLILGKKIYDFIFTG